MIAAPLRAFAPNVIAMSEVAPLPEPLVAPDCDLRGMPCMLLDTVRLTRSGLTAHASGDEFRAAVLLWCESWTQLPASSLPDDDAELAHLAHVSRTRWKRMRAGALRGWIKCSDGRLYHPVVAEKAREAWGNRIAQRDKARKRWARDAQGSVRPSEIPENSGDFPENPGISAENPAYRADDSANNNELPLAAAMPGNGKENGKEDSVVPDGTTAPPAGGASELFPDARTALFSLQEGGGLGVLMRMTGRPEKACRSFIGKALKQAGDDAAVVRSIILDARCMNPADPTQWIAGAVKARFPDPGGGGAPQLDLSTAQTPAAMFLAWQRQNGGGA